MINLDKLLKQKGWTGAELGRLEIANTMLAFEKALKGEPDPHPTINEVDFQKMVDTLEGNQGRIYNGYLAVHDWISRFYNVAVGQEQQAQHRYSKIAGVIENAYIAEQLYSYISKLPVIMTDKEYNDLVEKRTEEILHPDDGEPEHNIFYLLQDALFYYINQLHKSPRKKNPLKPLKKKLEKEPVTDQRILKKYNTVMGNGYYTLPDGRRSDEMSHEEWVKAIDPDGVMDESEIIQDRAFSRIVNIAKNIYNGMTEEEAENAAVENDRYFEQAEWHFYDEVPEDLNKWEILETGDLFEYYPTIDGEGTNEEKKTDIKAFKKEFPDVVDALLKDMEKYIKGASKLSVDEWITTTYKPEWLYEVDFYGFRDTFISDTSIFDGNTRALWNGIAILKPGTFSSHRIDDNGHYVQPDITPIIEDLYLEAYSSDSENYTRLAGNIEIARQVLTDSIYWINGYNTAIDISADYYNVEELKIAKIDSEKLIGRIQSLNDFIAMLYNRINNTDYENEELKAKKMGVLKDVFYPIDIDDLQTPEDKIEVAKSWLKDFKAFKENDKELCSFLCYREVQA
jgi:hypothetical protein